VSIRNKHGICVYCGQEKKLTVDHVPPKLLFATPYPANLLTVPSCRDCNKSFQKDDEYTRTVVCLDDRAKHHKDAKAKLPAVLRSLERPTAKAFADYLVSQSRETIVLGPNGIPLIEMELSNTRLNATGARIMRGLFYVETGSSLPQSAALKIGSTMGLSASDAFALQFARVYSGCSKRRDREIGEAFNYVAAFGSGFSIWLMMLYGYFFWAGTTDSRSVVKRPAPED
jgi:hypothetical protein